MTQDNQRDRRIEAVLFGAPMATYAYFYQGADQSVACRFDLIRSILERRTLWIDGYCGFNTADLITFGGHYYSVKAPGAAFVAMIPYIVASSILRPILWHSEDAFWAAVTYLTTVLSSGLLTALATVVVYRFARLMGAARERGATAALVYAFGTLAFPYATELTGEPIAGALLIISFYLVAGLSEESAPERLMIAGFLAGMAVLSDYPTILIAAAIGVYAIARIRGPERILRFSIGAGVAAAIMFQYNRIAFGRALFFSYQAYTMPENFRFFPEQSHGFVGLTYPRLVNLWHVTFEPQRGLFFCCPVLLLALVGVMFWMRELRWRREAMVAAFAFIAMVLFNASFGESIISWGGGTATGPRQIVAAMPFLALGLAFLPRGSGWLIGVVGGLSAWMMLMATATNPHFPYEYDNPVRDFAMQNYLRGDFASNRDAFFGGAMITRDSIAFNLGKLMGLPRAMQLIPLGNIWIVGALELSEVLGDWRSRSRRLMNEGAIAAVMLAIFTAPAMGALARPLLLTGNRGLLGRYYTGNDTGLPPHLERVDATIDFPDITSLAALPFPSVIIWRGDIDIDRAGNYDFRIDVDDSGWVSVDGHAVIADPGPKSVPNAEGSIDLARGRHRIEVGERNIAGGAAIRMSWRPPGASEFAPVPASVLTPERMRAASD